VLKVLDEEPVSFPQDPTSETLQTCHARSTCSLSELHLSQERFGITGWRPSLIVRPIGEWVASDPAKPNQANAPPKGFQGGVPRNGSKERPLELIPGNATSEVIQTLALSIDSQIITAGGYF
jgi:hypothetical protein